MANYYSRLRRELWDQITSWSGGVGLVVLIASYFTGRVFPSLAPFGIEAERAVPVIIAILIALLGLLLLPKRLHDALDDEWVKRYEALELELASIESELRSVSVKLREQRDCQGIANMLTTQYEFGVHELMAHAPRDTSRDDQTTQRIQLWANVVANWNDDRDGAIGLFATGDQPILDNRPAKTGNDDSR